ncbi:MULTISPECIES: tyrosine-type recombinase/integrase [Winogradskyella]|uniref:Site-specific recombinase XerD n=2 Tax=Winogradskyella TaxID=286104 RepID=A0A1G8JJV2_9FLAO|nr:MULTISPECIES: site-specific integrase [Winogradskyella]REE07672.1 site-specific recombinase XerD [Winogradskyella pacifica]SDI31343.1 Site-specific recombinase XerD [Winogradskyella thalassocola]
MARAKLILDTRAKSKTANEGLFPIVVRVFHKRPRMIRLPYKTSKAGWDANNMTMKKSVSVNKDLDCDEINKALYEKLHSAKTLINELGDTLNQITVDTLVENIKKIWDDKLDSKVKKDLSNEITIAEWGNVLINRKLKSNKPATANWYKNAITAFEKFNNNSPVKFHQITVTFLTDFEIEHLSKGNSKNCISSYARAIRAIYNSAIKEDVFIPFKHPFSSYKIPSTTRTKKKALSKEKINAIRNLKYEENSTLWHTRNYFLAMFNCRGMNLIDLAKLKLGDIKGNRIFYGRSKTNDPLSIRITTEFSEILNKYTHDKEPNDFIFPIGYDGSVEAFKKYRSDRRLINKLLKKIAKDANIEEKITSYYIRHSWATIAKNMGISTEIISEGLGHQSIRTTEVYLKSFENIVLDEANDLIVG